jgi:hypothetical protein
MYTRPVNATATRAGVSCLIIQVRSTFFFLLLSFFGMWMRGEVIAREMKINHNQISAVARCKVATIHGGEFCDSKFGV